MEKIVKTNNFIGKLDSIINNSHFSHIIHYDQGNCKLTIFDRQRFQTEIIPFYFRHANFTSFIRQLNLYGFKKNKKSQFLCFTNIFIQKGQQLRTIIAKKKLQQKKNKVLTSHQREEHPHPEIIQSPYENQPQMQTQFAFQESNHLDRLPSPPLNYYPFLDKTFTDENILKQEVNPYNISHNQYMGWYMPYATCPNPLIMTYLCGPS